MPSFLSWQPVRAQIGSRRFAPPLWTFLLTALVAAALIRLGYWQLARAAYKQQILDHYAERAHSAPQDWPDLRARGQDIDDVPVQLAGQYDNSHNVLLDNQLRDGVLGYHLLTVFRVAGSADAVLVDRGWVPASLDRRVLPAILPATATTLSGAAAMPSATFTVAPEDYRQQPLRVLRLEPKALAALWGIPLQPFLIRLDPAAPDGFVREWAPAASMGEFGPDRSRGYAFQWFAMAAAVVIVFLVVNTTKIREA